MLTSIRQGEAMRLRRRYPGPHGRDARPAIAAAVLPAAAIATAITLAVLAPVVAPAVAHAGTSMTASLVSDGLVRTYRVHVPPAPLMGPGRPLVVVLHGRGGSGAQAERAYGFDALADREGFVVAYPDGVERGWNDADLDRHADVDDVAFLTRLVDDLSTRYAVEPHRVYVAGMSNGGFMAERLACEMPDRIAAVGVVAASRRAACPGARPVSVMHVHGLRDRLVRYAGASGGAIGAYPSLPSLASGWRHVDGCRPLPVVRTAGVVRRAEARGCALGTDVVLVTIATAGHEWPGGRRAATPAATFDATAELWAFFEEHPRP